MSQICCDMRVTYKTELETAPMSIGVAGASKFKLRDAIKQARKQSGAIVKLLASTLKSCERNPDDVAPCVLDLPSIVLATDGIYLLP